MIVLQGRKKPVHRLAFVSGTRLLAACLDDVGTVVWDLDAQAPVSHWHDEPFGVTAGWDGGGPFGESGIPGSPFLSAGPVPFPDRSRVLVATFSQSANARVRCLRVGPDGNLTPFWDGPPGLTWSEPVVFPDGRRYAALEYIDDRPPYAKADLIVGDADTGGVTVRVQAGPMHYHEPLRVHPDGTRLVGVVRSRLLVWDAATGERVAEVPNPDGKKFFTDAAFHPAGRWLLTSCNGATVRVWDAAGWGLVRTYTWDVGRVKAVAVSPDGALVAAGGDKGAVVVWDADG